MKLAIVGSRDLSIQNYDRMLGVVKNQFRGVTAIVSGGAPGADALAEQVADALSLPKIIFPADWRKHGRAAGPIRNRLIAQECDYLLAFVNKPLAESRGTNNCVNLALDYQKSVRVILATQSKFSTILFMPRNT